MSSLHIDTSRHTAPDTTLSQAELDELEDAMEEADRDEFAPLLQKLIDSLKNPYFKRELDHLDECLKDRRYRFREIKSDARGVLLKLTPSQKGGATIGKGTFHFKSHQVHHLVEDGKRKTRKNIVVVHGNKGTKRVVTYDSERPRKRYARSKTLSKKEIKNIKEGKFMPGLFKGMN